MAQEKKGSKADTGVVLSKRLRMLADMVTPGNRLVDVGCDHGFLSIYLVQAGICPRALAMDVRTGPLEAAVRHVREAGLGDYIDLRLSDGLTSCGAGEADVVICAGMGGRLMEKVLSEGMDKAGQMKELILQPQSEIPQFRASLRRAGFSVVQEDAVFEEGKYYFAMKAVPGGGGAGRQETAVTRRGRWEAAPCESVETEEDDAAKALIQESDEQQLYDLYGKELLAGRHPVLLQYLRQREAYIRKLEASLEAAGSRKAEEHLTDVRRELAQIGKALAFY